MNYLEGNKIKLVKFTDRFITPEYIGWLNDSEVNRYLCTGRFPVSSQDMYVPKGEKDLMFSMMSNMGEDSVGSLWQDEECNHYVGTLSLHDISWIDRKGEIGYMLGSKKHWGLGIITEAINLITHYAFNRLNLNKVSAGVVSDNIGSIKALEKNGFKQCGTLPQDHFVDGKFFDGVRFCKLREWK